MLEYRSIYRKNAYRNTIANNPMPFLRTSTNNFIFKPLLPDLLFRVNATSVPFLFHDCWERPSSTLQTREIEPSSKISYSPPLAACRLPCWNEALTNHVICSSLNRRSAIGCCSLLWKSVLRIAAGLSTTGLCGLNCDIELLAVLWLLFLAAGTS